MPEEDWRVRLAREYLAGMPEKLGAIESFLVRLRAAPGDRPALASLRAAVHRLAGSAGTHGLVSVGETALAWESFLGGNEAPTLDSADIGRMDRWLDEIRRHVLSATDGDVSPLLAASAAEDEETTPAPLLVLVVDDVSSVAQVVRLLLVRLGQHADVASSGAEAVAAVARGRYDLVLIDVQMPEMDGLETARRIRALGALPQQPRIVAMTTGDAADDVERRRAAGMDGCLTKPVSLAELRRELVAVSRRLNGG